MTDASSAALPSDPTPSGRPSRRAFRKIKFPKLDGFHADLKAHVERYFAYTRKRQRDSVRMYIKTGTIILWFAASYVLLVFFAQHWWQGLLAATSMGLAMAAVGFNIQHDGGHKAYSQKKWVNRIMASSLDLLGGSSYVWDHKHNTLHHTYANIMDHDDDINLGFLARVSPHQRRLWFHRLQHIYLWFLYGMVAIKWQLIDDYKDIIRGKVGNYPFARPRNWDLAIFIGGKVVSLSLAFVIPLFFHSVLTVICFYLFVCWVNGLSIAVVFQLAHVVEEAEFPQPDEVTGDMDNNWAVHQVKTTVDFARRNWFLTWFLGGLNFQVEHHLFPKISHIHYPKISRIVERTCQRYGLQYNSQPTFWGGVMSHFRWLRRMGQPVAQ
jgi:linoleoyl-CoA desaturase